MSKSTYLVKIGSEHFLVKALNIADVFTSLQKEGVKDLELVYCKSLPYFKPKRKPLEDGTLPMTIGEFSEFSEMMGYENISEIFYDNRLHFKCFGKGWGIITDVKAIAYLLDRFNLEVGNA